MQPDRFTVKAQEAVAGAQALAAERRNPQVTPAHLLVALLRQEEGIAAPILQKLNVDVGALTAEAMRAVEDLPKLAETAEVRPSSTFVAVLPSTLIRTTPVAAVPPARTRATTVWPPAVVGAVGATTSSVAVSLATTRGMAT